MKFKLLEKNVTQELDARISKHVTYDIRTSRETSGWWNEHVGYNCQYIRYYKTVNHELTISYSKKHNMLFIVHENNKKGTINTKVMKKYHFEDKIFEFLRNYDIRNVFESFDASFEYKADAYLIYLIRKLEINDEEVNFIAYSAKINSIVREYGEVNKKFDDTDKKCADIKLKVNSQVRQNAKDKRDEKNVINIAIKHITDAKDEYLRKYYIDLKTLNAELEQVHKEIQTTEFDAEFEILCKSNGSYRSQIDKYETKMLEIMKINDTLKDTILDNIISLKGSNRYIRNFLRDNDNR